MYEWVGLDERAYAYIVDMTSEVEKNSFGELAPVDFIAVTEILVGQSRFVNVQHLLPVVRSSFENVGTIGHKVVQRSKHF